MQLNKKVIARTALCAVLISALGYSFVAKSETKLIPFQGKLTDASGQVVKDGTIVVQFKMYDKAEGGVPTWNGEMQMLSVNNGLINTTLGTKASLKNIDFSNPTYLEITIDANGDGKIGKEDPPLYPRQAIIPAVYAVESANAQTLKGYDWSCIFDSNNPNDPIPGYRIEDQGITDTQIANGAVKTEKIATAAVTAEKIAPGAVKTDSIEDEAVTLKKLDEQIVTIINRMTPVGAILPFGGDNIPAGWLLCDGRPLSSSQYPALYEAIGKNWGAGLEWSEAEKKWVVAEGCDFSLPDLRGVFLRGVNGARGGDFADPEAQERSDTGRGGAIGNHVGSYQLDALQNHSHYVHWGKGKKKEDGNTGGAGVKGGGKWDGNASVNSYGDLIAHEIRFARVASETHPKNAYVNYIIKY